MLAEKYMKMVWNGVAYNKYENLYNVIRKYAENNLQEQIIARAMTYSGYRSDNPSVQMYVEISATHDICEDIIKHDTLARDILYNVDGKEYVLTPINGENLNIFVEVVK